MKLYKQIPDTQERGHTVVYELATPAEIMAAHPKCGECGCYDVDKAGFCTARRLLMHPMDYCPSWMPNANKHKDTP